MDHLDQTLLEQDILRISLSDVATRIAPRSNKQRSIRSSRSNQEGKLEFFIFSFNEALSIVSLTYVDEYAQRRLVSNSSGSPREYDSNYNRGYYS